MYYWQGRVQTIHFFVVHVHTIVEINHDQFAKLYAVAFQLHFLILS